MPSWALLISDAIFQLSFTMISTRLLDRRGEDCLSGRPAGTLKLYSRGEIGVVTPPLHDPYAALIANFHMSVQTGTPISASGRDAAIALATALAAVQSASTGIRTAIESLQ